MSLHSGSDPPDHPAFFGAPYLDGRHPSIFLARGIYTRHKMIALDVNPATHELTERWRWNCSDASSPWYGNGYHNYAIADVDWDGRDEICFGSMVIDDNGKGLSTTGFGHGDAQHHGDFNPYVHGQEIFACLEDAPYWGNNYRDGTTSKVYYKYTSGRDDGRCIAGNFSNDYPGAMAFSGYDEPISCVTADHISGMGKGTIPDNFRIYWDGDLCEEGFNYVNGKNTAGGIYKYGKGLIETLAGSKTNNDTKGTACYQGDILGDWREEVIMRTADHKIRIYSTTIPTEWRNYTLWHDMQYRQAMVWQMCGYNQPPHVSYFLGELEGITQAPPALTMTGRVEVKNGETISTAHHQKDVLIAETGNITVSYDGTASPHTIVDNAPTWVQGHDNNSTITTSTYTHTITGGSFHGATRLVKQGDGILKLAQDTRHEHEGPTDIWAGTVIFGQGLTASHVWMNRFAKLETYPGIAANFGNGIEAEYGSAIRPGGNNQEATTLTTTTLKLGFGSAVEFDVFAGTDGPGSAQDLLSVQTLTIEKKDWQYGPEYSTPIFRFIPHYAEGQTTLAAGKYEIVKAQDKVEGSVEDLVIEGLDGQKYHLESEQASDGTTTVCLVIEALRPSQDITWIGSVDNIWDLGTTENFQVNEGGQQSYFVTGDAVVFGSQAKQYDIVLNEDVSPAKVVFNEASQPFTLSGQGSITGSGSLECNTTLGIQNVNKFSGGVMIGEGGRITVSSLANSDGTDYGALGGIRNPIRFSKGTLAVNNTIVCSQPVTISSEQGTIEVPTNTQLTLSGTITGTYGSIVKTGAGTLQLNGTAQYGTLSLNQGTVLGAEINDVHQYPTTIVLNGGTLKDPDNIYSYSTNKANIEVPEGKTATWTLDSRCDYKGKLTGKGNLTVNVTSTRCKMQGDWSQFEGTITFKNQKTGSYDPDIVWDNSYGLGKATITGTFNNNGKNVSVGTLQGNVTLTGGGTYTVKKLDLNITRVRGNNSNSLITAVGTLSITGEINITQVGSAPSAGDKMTLWKVGKLSTSSSVVVNLPTLPAGLYWDTTDLLKPEGILRVTDQPLGIQGMKADADNDGKTYTLSGTPIDNPIKKGIYIKNGKKIVIK